MRHPRNVFGRRTVFHGGNPGCDHVCSARTNDVHTENFVSLFVSQDLDQPVSVHAGAGAAKRFVRKATHLVSPAVAFQLFLCKTYAGHFRPRVDNARDEQVIDMRLLASETLGNIYSFLFRCVCCIKRVSGRQCLDR